jgi:hypothetical protein
MRSSVTSGDLAELLQSLIQPLPYAMSLETFGTSMLNIGLSYLQDQIHQGLRFHRHFYFRELLVAFLMISPISRTWNGSQYLPAQGRSTYITYNTCTYMQAREGNVSLGQNAEFSGHQARAE